MSTSSHSKGPPALPAFAYVHADKAPVYRRLMRAFMRARDAFRLHLRPSDIQSLLAADGFEPADDLAQVEGALRQLCEWGNLVPHPDTAEVSTIQEFYRPRFLYQLTAQGEAAERAISEFERTLKRPGELQTAALQDIRTHLAELALLAEDPELDAPKVVGAFSILRERFNSLTDRAQSFMASLHRGIDLHGLELQLFVQYKERLIQYLERFIHELIVATSEIAELIERIEHLGHLRLLEAAAAREVVDRLGAAEEDAAQALEDWLRRWEGLRVWFIPHGSQRSQAEVLRATARAAIPQMLSALASLHDRRVTRSDRAQDFRTLARWFAECRDDDDAHVLFRVAFGLAPARHLSVDTATLEARDQAPIHPSTSWLEAPPLRISPRLRTTGRLTRRGRLNNVIDRSEQKQTLAKLAADGAAQLARAQSRFATGIPFRLSSLGSLAKEELEVLLDVLGDALSQRGSEPVVETTSGDGTLLIHLAAPHGDAEAVLETEEGLLRTPDFELTVRRVEDASLAVGTAG